MDCPELFELPLDGNPQNKKWILYGGPGAYIIGDFDGKEFKPESGEIQYSYGNCFYASQTFSNVPESDGRRIQMAWGTIRTPGMPFNMIQLFPVELTLKTTEEGIRMFAYPVKEIENIYAKEHAWNETEIEPGQNILSDAKGELFDIEAEFATGGSDEFGFVINGLTVKYDQKSSRLSCDGEVANLKPMGEKIRLRILVDRVSIEIFANDGRVYMPVRAYNEKGQKGVEIITKGGNTMINSLKVHELKTIWDQ